MKIAEKLRSIDIMIPLLYTRTKGLNLKERAVYMSRLTREQADNLIKMKKIVTSSVSWRSSSKNVWRLETRALTKTTKEILILKGYIGRDNYSFVLLYNNIPIRKFTKHHKHTWNGADYFEPHKHIWDEVTEDKEIYIPDDIDPSDDVSTQFLDFCKECNVELKGGYQTFLFEETR